MIGVPDDDPSRCELWEVIADLSELAVRWVLIGGQMVWVHAELAGRQPLSVTADADAVADIRTRPAALEAIAQRLRGMGFVAIPGSGQFVKKAQPLDLKVDVLKSEGAGERLNTSASKVLQTIEAQGANQALRRTQRVPVSVRGRPFEVPVPNLLGALVLKACAVDRVGSDRDKHKRDFVFLLSLVDDPIGLGRLLDSKDRKRLHTGQRHLPLQDPAWVALADDDARRAQLALRLLLQ